MTRTSKRKKPARHRATVSTPRDAELVRLARVREARRRIADGFYDRDDVRNELVQAVLDEIRRD